jgi:ribosomal protein S13
MNLNITPKKFNFFIKTYKIYGVGKNSITPVYFKKGLNLRTRPKVIKKIHLSDFYKITLKVGKKLKFFTKKSISFKNSIRLCAGIRYRKGYPIRGQRTHTNARTTKKLRFR